MVKKEDKVTIKSIYKWFRSDTGKRISFVVFYLIFFIVLFLLIGTPTDTKNSENIVSLPFKTTNIENNNYEFTYKEIINNEETILNGNRNGNTITLDNVNYIYKDGELVTASDSSNNYYQLLDIYEIKNLVKSGTLITKVEFPLTNETDFNYDIKSSKLNNLFNSELEILDDTNNKLVVNCDKNMNIKKITLDIYNYYQELNHDNSISSYVIEINYGG